MRKVFTILLAIVLGCASQTNAEEPKTDKVKTLIELRNDVNLPKDGDHTLSQQFFGWWQYKWMNGVLESTVNRHGNYFEVKPSFLAGVNLKSAVTVYFLGGLSTNDNGSNFVQTGLWYIGYFGQVCAFLDARNYWSISRKNDGYMEDFLRLTHPLGKKFFAGVDLDYIHWWDQRDHNLYFAGPLVGYKLTDKIDLYVRVSREWDINNGTTSSVDRVRTVLRFCF